MDVSLVAALAATQHSVVSTTDLAALGLTEPQIAAMVRCGFLRRVARAVYVIAGSQPTWQQRLKVAELASGGLISHRSGARLQTLERAQFEVVDVLTDRHRRSRLGGVVMHETLELWPADRAVVGGIAVTSVERTLLDVGRYLGPFTVGRMLDHAVRDGRTTYRRFERRFYELSKQGRNGIGTARQVLRARGFGDGVGFEKLMRMSLRDAGMPPPVREKLVRVEGRKFFIDFAYPDSGLGIECDSREWHTLPYQIEHDLERQNHIVGTGVLLLRYTYARLVREPGIVVDEIRRHLESRSGIGWPAPT